MAEPGRQGESARQQTGIQAPVLTRFRRLMLGGPRDLLDRNLWHKLALVPFLAWVGLGADGLSSSAYGPEAAFHVLQGHTYLAVVLALATAGTVALLAKAYSVLIESFPSGGAYVVATRMLGPRLGLLAGAALVVDYLLTIAASVAAAGKAVFSLLPREWAGWLLPADLALLLLLLVLNLRGVKESITILVPIFLVFVATHGLLIASGILIELPEAGSTAAAMGQAFQADLSAGGWALVIGLVLKAYAQGGGTYTGLEAVSNAVPMMREPRVANAQRTLAYLALSLSVCAGGLIMCYLLWHLEADPHRSMNALLAEKVFAHLPGGRALVWATMLSSAALLLVAAQAGFIAGPRVMANMAIDSWLPRTFATMSERLTISNGILMLAAAAIAVIWITGGEVEAIVVMYAANVFLTFALSMVGMLLWWWRQPAARPRRRRNLLIFAAASLLCSLVLATSIHTSFQLAAIGLSLSGGLVALCLLIRAHYRSVAAGLTRLYMGLESLPPSHQGDPGPIDRSKPTAVVLVSRYGGTGIHTVLNVFRAFPGHFRSVIFVSVGVMDSGVFKGEDAVAALRLETEESLRRYVSLAHGLGFPAEGRYAIGTDPVDEAARLCLELVKDHPHAAFFAGKVIFRRQRWYHWLLHNDAALALQRRLQLAGRTVVVMPARI